MFTKHASRCFNSYFFGKSVLWKHAFFKSELLRFVELISGLRVRCFWSWCDLADPNSFPAKPQCLPTQNKQLFCIFMLLLSDLKTRLWFSTTHRLFWFSTWGICCDLYDVDKGWFPESTTFVAIIFQHSRRKSNPTRWLKICNSWDCISIEIRRGFALSSSFTVKPPNPSTSPRWRSPRCPCECSNLNVGLHWFESNPTWPCSTRWVCSKGYAEAINVRTVRSWDFMNL